MGKKNKKRSMRFIEQETTRPYQVLLPVASITEARVLLPLAEAIVKDRHGYLTILCVTKTNVSQPLSEMAGVASQFRQAVTMLVKDVVDITVHTHTLVRPAEKILDEIWEIVEASSYDLLITAWSTPTLNQTAIEEMINPRLETPPCDIVAVRVAHNVLTNWDDVQAILLPVRGGVNAGLTLRIGHALARQKNASITLLHVANQTTNQDKDVFSQEFTPALYELRHVERSVTRKGDIPKHIIQEAFDHDVVVMGAPSRQRSHYEWRGPLLDQVIDGIQRSGKPITLIVVKEKKPLPLDTDLDHIAYTPETYQVGHPVSVIVDQWFAENTYHSREFEDLERLLALKQTQGVTISLGLPALNEARTVGDVIDTIKTSLMDEIPLLDEIVLIDSGSVDYTREIASELGIPVYIHQEILPQYGAMRGKGEALWKSLYVLQGDIIAWIDTDIRNIHPRFVYGILGPLLRDHQIQYVKGFYRRPLRQGNKVIAGGGGRVTELTARPLINMFFPELSGIIQPLAGEYAGRRSALETLPFYTGYGVETGLILDILENFGLNAIAQTDLQKRVHHNQPLPSLSKMSFAIMQVFLSRMDKRYRTALLPKASLKMNLIQFSLGHYYLDSQEIYEIERPPMNIVPEYLQKHYTLKSNTTTELKADRNSLPE